MNDQVNNETVQETTAPAPAPELNLNDLAGMRSLIEIVTQRGAFKAEELSSVGILFDKINAFLKAAQAAQPAPQPAPEGE
jgi:hypothetical protein